MDRIKFMQGYWDLSPSKEDFVAYDAEVLITRLFGMYILCTDGKPEMLHPFQIAEVITDKQAVNTFKQAMFDFVNNLSDSDWSKVCRHLNLKHESNNG